MKSHLYDRLFRREMGRGGSYSSIRGLYGDRTWVDDLDIVNELGGHSGCVNALNWSNSGTLLASGSDDQNINIYTYQPESITAPFFLNTSITSGHSANIFSVKFMPHSGDRTLVSCAGDSEVRVFDIEHSGRSSNTALSGKSRRTNEFFNGMWFLTESDTNCRVYRSHADRVKRIVTESSPFLFLTCSEDGEVRQWDLRQPSSAYPSPRGGQGFMSYRPGLQHDDSNVPPPLISYKKYQIDLNTISCAARQPHYIALGGAHLHCFLHDRRMAGRDLMEERGQTGSPSGISSTSDEVMARATRCVRRFAPGGKPKMRARDNGHITACKISNARPNEMVVSWSADHIYSFDLSRSPDALDQTSVEGSLKQETRRLGRVGKHKDRKRKRGKASSPNSVASQSTPQSRPRYEGAPSLEQMSFRVRYGNGESEDIPFDSMDQEGHEVAAEDVLEQARDSVLTEAQKLSHRIAKGLVKIRKLLFSIDASIRDADESSAMRPYTASFTEALGYAATYLPMMDDVIRNWGYPITESHDDIIFQQALRRNRESSRRFVQASGTLARVLGGQLLTASSGDSPQLSLFRRIVPAPTENSMIDPSSQFGYDFLKAILLWVEGGRSDILSGFKPHRNRGPDLRRYPIPDTAGDEGIEDYLIPYLRELAGNEPIVNIDASRFEHDDSRFLYRSQFEAVEAFSNAIRLPLEDLEGRAATHVPGTDRIQALDRETSIRFWGLKVGRSLLMQVGEGINFQFVNRAFGGLRTVIEEDEDDGRERTQEDISSGEEMPISELRLITTRQLGDDNEASVSSALLGSRDRMDIDGDTDNIQENLNEEEDEAEDNEDEGSGSDNDNEDEDDDDSTDSDEEEGQPFALHSSSSRRRGVESHVPCSSHMNVYRGHCNVNTVKDVNYFGLDDEYVVSGSDCGNLFIWDRKTSDVVNILQGDSDVVNVIQGHPYEPTLAVSGIDNTIKIFSPDARAQYDAQAGINIADPEAEANVIDGGPCGSNHTERSDLGLKSRKQLENSYRIMSQNDVNRQGGMNEARITRSMLSQLAVLLRTRQSVRLGLNGAPGGDDGSVVLDDCSVM